MEMGINPNRNRKIGAKVCSCIRKPLKDLNAEAARDPGPREFLRATIEDVNLIQKEANSAFYVAIAEIAQRSNIYTEINQLPEEIMLNVITDYIELSGQNVRRRSLDSRYDGYPSRRWVELRQVYVIFTRSNQFLNNDIL